MAAPIPSGSRGRRRWARRAVAWLAGALWATAAAADDGWRVAHRDEAEDITVEVLDRGEAPPMFRATSRLQARLSACVAVLLDTAAMPEWVDRAREARVLVQASPTAGRVRMPAHRSSWRLRPLEGGGVEAVFEGWADLGGHLNATPLRAFVRAALWQAPAATMAGLRRMVQRPVYRDARDARPDLVRDGAP